jgi:hypothetical protein
MGVFQLRHWMWIAAVLLGLGWRTALAFECPHPSEQLGQDVSEKVTTLSQTTNDSFQAKAGTVTHDVFEKYPHADQVAIATTFLSMYCQILLPSAMPDAEKLDRLDRLEAVITREKGISVPLDKSVGPECSTAPAEVLRPIRALFAAWATLDVDEYLAQWGPNAIARSKYYVRKVADLGPRRRADFALYRAVDVVTISPKIAFADHTKAVVQNVYTMRFTRTDGKVVEESNVGESYVLECSAGDHKWLIRENNDYLSAD